MESTLRTPQTDPPPPPTAGEKVIEAARRRARQLYHIPPPTNQFDNWYIDEVRDSFIAPRVQDLYDDREQTNRQQSALFIAKTKLPDPRYTESGVLIETSYDATGTVYQRTLQLYDARLKFIQQEGVTRLSIWSDWWQEQRKPYYHRNDQVIAACESTLAFMEDDFIKRKVDFVTEIYAVLEKHDPVRAKAVLDDLGNMWPWLKTNFIRRQEHYVVVYEGLKKKLPQV